MADDTLDDSLRRPTTKTDINKGSIVSANPRPQASHW